MLVRRETPDDVDAIREVTARAFAPSLVESPLVDALRADPGWIPQLSLVATDGVDVIGHVLCTRATVAGRPALGLGPLSVDPPWHGRGVGSALVHAVLGAADARDEPLVVLLGDPAYYRRFGFVRASEFGIDAPDVRWGVHFQARTLATYQPELRGQFRYAEPFLDL